MLGLGLGLQYLKSVLNAIVAKFISRVKEDGGTTEGVSCVTKTLNSYPNQETSRVLMDAYIVRVEAAGGTVEAKQCSINELNTIL